MRLILLFILSFTFSSILVGQNQQVKVSGKQKDLANIEVKLLGYTDLITANTRVLGIDTANAKGEFEIVFELEETQQVILPYGIYTGILFVEPGKDYELILPEYKEKTMAEILNPYFVSTEIFFGTNNTKGRDINIMIAEFDEINSEFIERFYFDLFKNPKQEKVDSVINRIENLYEENDNAYLATYRNYKYAWLKYVSYMRDPQYVVREHYHNKPIAYNNIAYMDLFNQLYNNYFSFYMLKPEGARLFSDLARAKSPVLLNETLENSLVLSNDTLRELVMLKGIHDAFYSDNFPFSSLLITLDSINSTTKIKEHRIIGKNIKLKALKAKTGYPAPPFSLINSLGNETTVQSYSGEYVYLNFISVESFTCQQDFELLKKMHETHQKEFTIVSISIDEDFEQAKAFFNQNGYEWPLLSMNNMPGLIDDYKVRAFPMYYLIGPTGKLLMSPAMAPGENFEYYFFKGIKPKPARGGQR